jgi:hypothetical protein
MSEYQIEIYDAIRNRFSQFDSQGLMDRIVSNFDCSMSIARIEEQFKMAAVCMQEASAIYRPKLSIDGNQWCALYGDNLQDGVAGFGDSPELAMVDFNKNWYAKL